MLCLPEVKQKTEQSGVTIGFDAFHLTSFVTFLQSEQSILIERLWNFPELLTGQNTIAVDVQPIHPDALKDLDQFALELFPKQGYHLLIQKNRIEIQCGSVAGFHNAISTVKQLMIQQDKEFFLPLGAIRDWPDIQWRSISTTFAWYAGYGRLGFDSQLWGFNEWKQFLNICADYKINQLNMCIYGYWPFEMPDYPETVLRNIPVKIWNPESENWVEVDYKHPNLANEFLPELIKYGHSLGIQFFAYIGLNSYSGGYSNIYREKRMKRPENCQFINDFDSLCLNSEGTLDYLRYCMRRVVDQGFDGIDFEESEEAFWYCDCPDCKNTFWQGASTPEEALHNANTFLLDILYKELKATKPDIIIGLRAWRQPPLMRDEELMASMVKSIPEDVVLFWAPGHYVEDSEFDKWIRHFGRERIRARDTEAIGFASGLGRLVRPFRFNGLRTEEESITQYIEEDIRQHIGSAQRHVAGINGYQFEWYGFFMAFFAHAYYGWGGQKDAESFYEYALTTVFGELSDDIYQVMKGMLTIHESQINLFELEFPFARNKVEERDIPLINSAIETYPGLMEKIKVIIEAVSKNPRLKAFRLHFRKWQVSMQRSRVIYDIALASLEYVKATDDEQAKKWLLKMDRLNEENFSIIKANYFDINPVSETGIQSCMIPYHELKRVIHNRLDPETANPEPIYLGVESLGWLWA
jgi:hypothetical protein